MYAFLGGPSPSSDCLACPANMPWKSLVTLSLWNPNENATDWVSTALGQLKFLHTHTHTHTHTDEVLTHTRTHTHTHRWSSYTHTHTHTDEGEGVGRGGEAKGRSGSKSHRPFSGAETDWDYDSKISFLNAILTGAPASLSAWQDRLFQAVVAVVVGVGCVSASLMLIFFIHFSVLINSSPIPHHIHYALFALF